MTLPAAPPAPEKVWRGSFFSGILPPLLFSLTLFLNALLLFLVQPMAAKMILPRAGGAPAVWNTCMLFFQILLLLGYSYAHLLTQKLKLNHQLLFHAVLLLSPLFFLPIHISAAWEPQVEHPVFSLLIVLTR